MLLFRATCKIYVSGLLIYYALILYCELGVKYPPYRPIQPSSTVKPEITGNIIILVHIFRLDPDFKQYV